MKQNKHNSKTARSISRLLCVFSLLLTVILLLACISACGTPSESTSELTDEKLIEERISQFVTAYNNGDMETVLECLDTKARNAFQALLNVLSGLAENATGYSIDLSDLFSLGVSMVSGDIIKVEIIEIAISNSAKATVTATMNLKNTESKTAYFSMTYENDNWYIGDITDKQILGSTDNFEQLGENINVTNLENFEEGIAAIEFEMNDKSYSGYINTKAEIIYYSEDDVKWTRIGNGAGFITTEDDDGKKSYTLFNEKGYKTITLNEDVFDAIIGYGGGMILVYKNTSTVTTEEHSYGVLDCNGNWIKQLTAGIELPNPNGAYDRRMFEYIGEGVFVSGSYYSEDIYFNTLENIVYWTDSCYFHNEQFWGGLLYGVNTGSGSNRAQIGYYSDYSRHYLPSHFVLHPDGTFEEIPEFTDVFEHVMVNTNGEYIRIYDIANGTEKEYTAFKSELISSVTFDGDFGLIKIKGKDGKTYFTVIDKECNQKVELTACVGTTISDGRIVCEITDDVYRVMDVNGNTIISENQGFKYIGGYTDGIAVAKKDDNVCYLLDVDGNPITIKLK